VHRKHQKCKPVFQRKDFCVEWRVIHRIFPNLLVLVLPHIKLTDWSYSLLTLHQVSFKLLLSAITLGKHIKAILQYGSSGLTTLQLLSLIFKIFLMTGLMIADENKSSRSAA
jgi:hypothetical protein